MYMLRKGFTLIELLIVITIIAILAGAAVPYVQDYIEDARLSKARADLGELRNAIIRWETENGRSFGFASDGTTPLAADAFQDQLVGPYLQNALTDPWGTPYYFSNEASIVYSAAQDRDPQTNRIEVPFRPNFAPTRASWVDANPNGRADDGDEIKIKFTRSVQAPGGIGNYTFVDTTGNFDTSTVTVDANDDRFIVITLADTGSLDVRAGRDNLLVSSAVTDYSDTAVDANSLSLGITAQGAADVPVLLKAAQ
jgi:type II secretion system protein G